MTSIVKKLTKARLIRPPSFVENGTQLEVYMGSVAYGVASDISDLDIYGFCIPPKDIIFPHLRGVIHGFGRQIQFFDQFQQHHILDASSGREYDLSIYGIVKYFQLCMDNNPNLIDSLFVPNRCVAFMTPVGRMVRDNRQMFLHKGCYAKYRGYAYSQLHKCRTKTPIGKRKTIIEEFGYDVKFAYHVKRLLLQVEQILMEGDLDLERNREELKAIRRGDVALEEIENWFRFKENQLDQAYHSSSLPKKPDEDRIKNLLLNCLEEHYGKLSTVEYADPTAITRIITEIKEVLARYE